MPAAWRSRTASADSALTGSVMATRPAADPPAATNTTVPPSAAMAPAGSSSAARSMPCSSSSRRLPTRTADAVDHAAHAAAHDRLEPVDLREAQLRLACLADDRLAQRVLGAGLQRRGEVQDASLVEARRRDHRRHHGPPQRERAGLVHDDGVDAAGRLERLAAPDEDAHLGALAGPDHDRRGRGEAHGARAGDDHDADEGREREGEPRLRPEHEPDDERAGRDQEHGRDEDLADPVGQALDRGLGALRALDQLDDPGERRVAPDARRAHHERAGRVDGGADDLVAGCLRGGDRLAGEHRLVDRGHALDHDAVDRHLVAGADAQEVAGHDDRELDVLLDPVTDPAGGRRLEPDEAADRTGRAALGARLEPPSRAGSGPG